MEITKFLGLIGLIAAFAFETAEGISCFSCSSSDRACRKGSMNELASRKDDECDYCTVLYQSKPRIYTLRGCRKDKSGYYTKKKCKDSITFEGEKRCFCFTDWCNGKQMDKFVDESFQEDTGYETVTGTKRPSSLARSWRQNGFVLVSEVLFGLMLLWNLL